MQAIQSQLKTAARAVAKVLDKNNHIGVLVIGFRKGMDLKEHRAPHPVELTVLEGKVIYKEGDAHTAMG